MNLLWGGMLVVGILYGAFTGHLNEVTQGAIQSSKEAVALAISLLGVTALWNGLLGTARESGILDWITEKIRPFLRFLFPRIPEGHPALKYIAVNVIANFFGVGAAATAPGLAAMEKLEELEREREETEARKDAGRPRRRDKRRAAYAPRGTASSEMCTFLILNISSLQLIPVNIIAYRAQYGSVNPTAIVGPAIAATAASTLAAVVFCKVMDGKHR